ncbi:hypothetical protein FACS1894217_00880 [Clostridia bacterium]|nr:hypothetical protein FACS1894217_00880 [Clostridia bacterium]
MAGGALALLPVNQANKHRRQRYRKPRRQHQQYRRDGYNAARVPVGFKQQDNKAASRHQEERRAHSQDASKPFGLSRLLHN